MEAETNTTAARRAGSTILARAELRFPEVGGRRSTTETTRAILADAARVADPALATRIEASQRWRKDYAGFIRDLTLEAADSSRALAMAAAGLDSMRRRLVVEGGAEAVPLAGSLASDPGGSPLGTLEIRGRARPAQSLQVPYRGRVLEGRTLLEQLERWAASATVESSFSAAVARVVEHPEWLSLPGRRVAIVGAGSEIGPLAPLCAWGASVLAVDVPDARVAERVSRIADEGAGVVRMPAASGRPPGADVLRELRQVRDWLAAGIGGDEAPVLGMYAYADGGAHVLLTGAFDALAVDLATRPGTALAYLATPTDAYLVPAATVGRAQDAYRSRGFRRLLQAPLQVLSGHRLYQPSYPQGTPVADVLIEQQGPNYAIAKRLQRWRGITAAAQGTPVSFNVAPATLTRSVTSNRVLAAAYAGARHFGIEIFEPATTRALMAALLVHDLSRPPEQEGHPEHLFSIGAAHGGLWTVAYEPRSALGLAALAGLPASLRRSR